MRVNIKYTDGELVIGDLDSKIINTMSLKCSVDEAKKVVEGLYNTFNNGDNLIKSNVDRSSKESEYEKFLTSCGYTNIGTYDNKSLYSGVLSYDGGDVIILQAVVDGRVNKQVNISSKKNGISYTKEYIGKVYFESRKW